MAGPEGYLGKIRNRNCRRGRRAPEGSFRQPPALNSTEGQDYVFCISVQGHGKYPTIRLLSDPAIHVSGIEDEELRITFDRNIRWRGYDVTLSSGDAGELLLPADQRLMEIKISASFPLWLSKLLSELKIYPASFSKYCTAYTRLMKGDPNHAQQYSYHAHP